MSINYEAPTVKINSKKKQHKLKAPTTWFSKQVILRGSYSKISTTHNFSAQVIYSRLNSKKGKYKVTMKSTAIS